MYIKEVKRFRPLSGHLISKYLVDRSYTIDGLPEVKRFRPLSGHLISKCYVINVYCIMNTVFPSPLGASYFQIVSYQTIVAFVDVSVPSRGILFPNTRSASTRTH